VLAYQYNVKTQPSMVPGGDVQIENFMIGAKYPGKPAKNY
jgi:hypothetical protein